jgi:hypothetical protein
MDPIMNATWKFEPDVVHHVDKTLARKSRDKNKELLLRVIAGFFAALIIFPYAIPKFRKWIVLGPKENHKSMSLNKVEIVRQKNRLDSIPIQENQSNFAKAPTATHFACFMGTLPNELSFSIFSELKTDLPNLALVCRQWQVLADDKSLYDMFFPAAIAITPQDWLDNLGVDAGIASRLPRCVHRDLEKGEHLLTWVPENIVFADDRWCREMALNADLVGDLTKNPKKGFAITFDPSFGRDDITKKGTSKKSRWVWINKDVRWRNKSFHGQEKLEREQGAGASISWLHETLISMLMKCNKSGERSFVWEPEAKDGQRTWIRVKDQLEKNRIVCSFTPRGIRISCDGDEAHEYVGVLLVRHSYGF